MAITDLPGLTYTRTGAAKAWRKDGTLAVFAPNVPRITDAGVTIEGQRTNLFARWDPTAAQVSVGGTTVNCSDVAAPASAPLTGRNWIALDNSVSTAVAWAACQSIPTSTIVTCSLLVETLDGSQPVFGTADTSGVDFQVRTQNGADLFAPSAKYIRRSGNVWEVQVTGTTPASVATTQFGPRRSASHNKRPLKFSGFQLELGTRASTPIITTGASATVGADNLYLGGLGSVLAAPFSVVADVAEAPSIPGAATSLVAVSSGSTANRLTVYRHGFTGTLRATVRANSVSAEVVGASTTTMTGRIKIALSFDGATMRWATNGVAQPSAAMPASFSAPLNRLDPFSGVVGEHLSGVGRATILFPYALTDAELVELTQ